MTTGIAAEDAPGAAVTNAAGPGAPLLSVVLGGLRAPETPDPTADIDGAEAMKMTSTKVLLVTTTGHTMNQVHVAIPLPLHHPDQDPRAKRASPGPTARLKTSTRPPALRNSLWGDLHRGPTPDPCLGHGLAPGPGLDASLGATDSPLLPSALFVCLRMFLYNFQL